MVQKNKLRKISFLQTNLFDALLSLVLEHFGLDVWSTFLFCYREAPWVRSLSSLFPRSCDHRCSYPSLGTSGSSAREKKYLFQGAVLGLGTIGTAQGPQETGGVKDFLKLYQNNNNRQTFNCPYKRGSFFFGWNLIFSTPSTILLFLAWYSTCRVLERREEKRDGRCEGGNEAGFVFHLSLNEEILASSFFVQLQRDKRKFLKLWTFTKKTGNSLSACMLRTPTPLVIYLPRSSPTIDRVFRFADT